MKYLIEDTKDGYTLSAVGPTRTMTVKEDGGHGDLEKLYGVTAKVWDAHRGEVEQVARPMGAH